MNMLDKFDPFPSKAYEGAKERISDAYDATKDKAGEYKDRASNAMQSGKERAEEKGSDLRDSAG
jgi:hypothetical protein